LDSPIRRTLVVIVGAALIQARVEEADIALNQGVE